MEKFSAGEATRFHSPGPDRFTFPAPKTAARSEVAKASKLKTSMTNLLRGHPTASDTDMELAQLHSRTKLPRSDATVNMLPRINKTPPLPTFQRTTPQRQHHLPRVEPSMMNTSLRRADVESESLPSPTSTYILSAALTSHPSLPSMATSIPQPPVFRTKTYTVVGNAGGLDRPAICPALPKTWTAQHDHLICLYDGKGHPPHSIIRALQRYDPTLKAVLYQDQITKRLRILDQVPEIDYWRTPFGSSATASASLVIAEAARARRVRSREGLLNHGGRSGLGGLLGKGRHRHAADKEGVVRVEEAVSTDGRVENY